MRNDGTIPFSKLRNRKNDVTVTFSFQISKDKNEEPILFLGTKERE
jgi:hypothetical protein